MAILVPNLACVAGVIFLGLTSLSVVVLTNLGTLAVYSGLAGRKAASPGFQASVCLENKTADKAPGRHARV